jgi:hypothetical protein
MPWTPDVVAPVACVFASVPHVRPPILHILAEYGCVNGSSTDAGLLAHLEVRVYACMSIRQMHLSIWTYGTCPSRASDRRGSDTKCHDLDGRWWIWGEFEVSLLRTELSLVQKRWNRWCLLLLLMTPMSILLSVRCLSPEVSTGLYRRRPLPRCWQMTTASLLLRLQVGPPVSYYSLTVPLLQKENAVLKSCTQITRRIEDLDSLNN